MDQYTQLIINAIIKEYGKRDYVALKNPDVNWGKKLVDTIVLGAISRYFIKKGMKTYPLAGRDLDEKPSLKRESACNYYVTAIEYASSLDVMGIAFSRRAETMFGLIEHLDLFSEDVPPTSSWCETTLLGLSLS